MHEQKPKVIYVMGAGRSGSTILGIALGNCADVFYAGELNLWLGKKGVSPLPGAERKRFWDDVRRGVAPEIPGRQARDLEKSAALFALRGRSAQRRLRKRYRRVAEELYRAIARTSEARHVIDSSHFPRRAKELQRLDGIDLHLLLLTRNPRDIVASYSDDDIVFPRFKTLNTNAYLWLTYLLSLFVFLRQPRERRLLVRYEAFLAEPHGALRQILDRIGSDAAIPDLTALQTGMAFQGNPILRSDVVALHGRPRRRSRGSPVTTILQLPWAAVFALLKPVVRIRASICSPGHDSGGRGLARNS